MKYLLYLKSTQICNIWRIDSNKYFYYNYVIIINFISELFQVWCSTDLRVIVKIFV